MKTRFFRALPVLAIAGVAALAQTGNAIGDPLKGHNATPGTLTCGDGVAHPTTSGSFPANAIQLTDGSGVFVVVAIPALGFAHAGGIPDHKLQTCMLFEPSIPESPVVGSEC